MRARVQIAAFLLLSLTAYPVRASSSDNPPADQQSLDDLEARATQAQPREQCFLYAQLVQRMTELSIRRYADGDVVKASSLLMHIQLISQKIHLSVADNDKRLKNAEILLSRTAFRLNEMLHSSSVEDRPLVEQTLAQVSKAQNEAMMQVFQK
jgi:hypothetical protein